MILRDNPVLLRELLVNLRSSRAFGLQLAYVGFLCVVVFFAWPTSRGGVARVSPEVAQQLFRLFFLGQFFLVALVAPTFAAGSITGEKERKTYEMLLASPLDLVARRLAMLRLQPLPTAATGLRLVWPLTGLALLSLGWFESRHGAGWGAMVAALAALAFAEAQRIERGHETLPGRHWLFDRRIAIFLAIPFAFAGHWSAYLGLAACYAAA